MPVVVVVGIGLITGVGAAAPAGASSVRSPGVRYSFTAVAPLGTNIYGTYDEPDDLNASGRVVGGTSATDKTDRAFYYDGSTHDIGSLGTQRQDVESVALGINDKNVVVGSSQIDGPGDSGQHAFVWHGAGLTDLGTGYPDHRSGSYADDINNHGLIVGVHYARQPAPRRAVTWMSGVMRELPDLGGTVGDYGVVSEALAVNSSGLIVGDAEPRNGRGSHGVYWRNGVIHDVGNLGGVAEGTIANAVNDSGEIVGTSDDTGNHLGAFVYRNGAMSELRYLNAASPARFATALGVNGSGVVVGAQDVPDSTDPNGSHTVATVWTNGNPTDLNRQVDGLPGGAELIVALRINNGGTILVQTALADGNIVSGILTPKA